GHQDWSEYLLYPSLPGSGEVTVFCSAMAGACLAFLWFNAYPADVFMGDTGSLMLGGVIATVALLIKQEVLLMLVGGLFVIEIASSFVQETFGIRRGRRLFSAAPLHHVFQNRGIAESKIVVRMWIVSVLFAAVALATLKIR
ncbi:MAG: phospho-N-acetylmuramoyl-pentapeptide-transferase, partial [Myxococcota bacterium]|nr:phospho-N-acetylmuramoyl-pentapeptide-transferase [Myxococcota bacterium]